MHPTYSSLNKNGDVNHVHVVTIFVQRWMCASTSTTFPNECTWTFNDELFQCNIATSSSSWWQALTIVNSSMNFLPSEVTSQYKAIKEIIQRSFLFRIPSEVTTTWQYGTYVCETYSFSGEHFCQSEETTTKWQIMYPKTNFLKSVFKNYFHFTHPIN